MDRLHRRRSIYSTIALLFVIAVLVNLPWEVGQAAVGLFAGISGREALFCIRCSLGDGVAVLVIYGAGWLTFGRQDWFRSPGPAGYALMAVLGLSIAVAIEWNALTSGRWQYSSRMPLVPGTGIGLTPVLQMLVLPPLIFNLAARLRPA